MSQTISEFSETRGADRKKMAKAILKLCRKYGVRGKLEEKFLGNPRALAVQISDQTGLSLTLDFDGKSPQPNVHVLSWHFSFDRAAHKKRIILPDFAQDRNDFHHRKATDVCYGWEQLYALMDNRLWKIKTGKAVNSLLTTLTFSNAMWGYLQSLYDMRMNEDKRPLQRHEGRTYRSCPHEDECFMAVGEYSTYGFIQPWPDENAATVPDEEKAINELFKQRPGTGAGEDYYVAMSEGMRDGRPLLNTSVHASSFYPERLFVWGEDEFGVPLPRYQVMEILKKLDLRGSAPFWDPCTVWRGYDRGWPTFHVAMRGDTDKGPRWYEALQKLGGKLPAGYEWDQVYQCSYGNLYVDLSVEEEAL